MRLFAPIGTEEGLTRVNLTTNFGTFKTNPGSIPVLYLVNILSSYDHPLLVQRDINLVKPRSAHNFTSSSCPPTPEEL